MDLKRFLRSFDWALLHGMYGCSHSSIIGFISNGWLKLSNNNSILDGAPSPVVGKGRTGQKNADILLCRGNKPFMVVEVETQVEYYKNKIKSIFSYLNNTKDFQGNEAGLMVMMNLCKGKTKYKHNWDSTKNLVKSKNYTIALVSIEKSRTILGDSTLDNLRGRNNYYPWEIVNIEYWIHTSQHKIVEGNLWRI